MANTVEFPGLGITMHISRTAFSLFGIEVKYYGLLIVLGILLAFLYVLRGAKKAGVSADTMIDVVLYGMPSAIIGARIYYVIFSFDTYRDSFWDIFKTWEGGLAIYGGIIGALLSTAIYCRIKKINFLKIGDLCAPGLLIGQAVGRWGNFINQEAFGGNTYLPWGMTSENVRSFLMHLQAQGITVNPAVPVHPTFLYESLWNVLGILALYFYQKKLQKFNGEILLLYFIWYGIGRMVIEGLRTDSLMLGPVAVSQLLAALSAGAGIAVVLFCRFCVKSTAKALPYQ